MNKKGVVLLSGGLDSLIALDIARKNCDVILALTFNYGQKAFQEEKNASSAISKLYNLEHETIDLSFLQKLTNNALTSPDNNDFNDLNSVWVPNRNGLFLNIAACYCDKLNLDYIIFGANKEEGRDFPDNCKEYIKVSDDFFKLSTLKQPSVLAPCINLDKVDMINYALDNNIDLKQIKSCYNSQINTHKKHCGECMSCKLLYKAILNSKNPKLIQEIF